MKTNKKGNLTTFFLKITIWNKDKWDRKIKKKVEIKTGNHRWVNKFKWYNKKKIIKMSVILCVKCCNNNKTTKTTTFKEHNKNLIHSQIILFEAWKEKFKKIKNFSRKSRKIFRFIFSYHI